jgi:hypothetical protein
MNQKLTYDGSLKLHHLGQCLFQLFLRFRVWTQQQIQIPFNSLEALRRGGAVLVDLHALQPYLTGPQERTASADHRPGLIYLAAFQRLVIKLAWCAGLKGANVGLARVRESAL